MRRNLSFEFIRHRASFLCVLIVACGLLAACGTGRDNGSDTESEIVPTATVVPSPTALSGPPRVGAVVWTASVDPETNAPISLAMPVSGDRVLYAAVPIESLPAGSQLMARWYFNDTTLDALDSSIRIDHDRAAGWLEFHIERTGPDPWPDGMYEIILTDGTNELQRSEFAIS